MIHKQTQSETLKKKTGGTKMNGWFDGMYYREKPKRETQKRNVKMKSWYRW